MQVDATTLVKVQQAELDRLYREVLALRAVLQEIREESE